MSKVLLINPSYFSTFGGTKVSLVSPVYPTLGLATIAGAALQRGHKVEILDLSWRAHDYKLIKDVVLRFKPDIVGITATTPLMNQLRDISVMVKDISKNIMIVGGGPHPSALPEATLEESMLDAVLVGEADFTFADICDGYPLSDIINFKDPTFLISSFGTKEYKEYIKKNIKTRPLQKIFAELQTKIFN